MLKRLPAFNRQRLPMSANDIVDHFGTNVKTEEVDEDHFKAPPPSASPRLFIGGYLVGTAR